VNDESVIIRGIFVSDGKQEEGTEKQITGTPISLNPGQTKDLDVTSSVLDVLKPSERLEERPVRIRVDVEPAAFSTTYADGGHLPQQKNFMVRCSARPRPR